MLSVQDLFYSYSRKKEVLHSLSFQLEESQVGVLLGPNGSGKSTLLKCISSVLPIEKGHIYIDKKDISLLKPKERAKLISYVSQSYPFSSLSVFDSVLLGRMPYLNFKPTKEDEDIAYQAIQEMKIEVLAMKNVAELSQGQRQKVAIARALAQQSSLLLFDEPTSALDLASQLNSLFLIQDIVKKKRLTALLSLHDLNQALLIGDVFFFLKDGCLVTSGDESVITKENIRNVYGVDVNIQVIQNRKNIIYQEEKVR